MKDFIKVDLTIKSRKNFLKATVHQKYELKANKKVGEYTKQ